MTDNMISREVANYEPAAQQRYVILKAAKQQGLGRLSTGEQLTAFNIGGKGDDSFDGGKGIPTIGIGRTKFYQGWNLLVLLVLVLLVGLLPSAGYAKESGELMTDSPGTGTKLSDVWHWRAPNPDKYSQGSLRTYLLDNDDVLILYWNKLASKRVESRQVTFFNGMTLLNQSSNLEIMRSPKETLVLSDGSRAKITKNDLDNNGEILDGTFLLSGGFHFKDCFVGPAKAYLIHYSAKTNERSLDERKVLKKKIVFFIPEKPGSWKGGHHSECYEAEHKLNVPVIALQGHVLGLPDGGFLLVDGEVGIIVRFRRDFTTGTELLNRSLFVYDLNDSRTKSIDYLFMPQFNGKDYTDEKDRIRMQEVLNDLHEFLIKQQQK